MDTSKIVQGWRTPSADQWSEFFEGLKADSLASAGEINFDKIFAVAIHYYEMGAPWGFLYYIDLSSACKDNDNSIQPLQPVLQFRSQIGTFFYRDYVVVGSKLFMFGESDVMQKDWKSGWCYYDFSEAMDSASRTLTEIKERDLKFGPAMRGRKCVPNAVVVGGCKICVFDSFLYDKNEIEIGYRQSEPRNFEVYDTVNETWTELPELANYSEYELDYVSIQSYCVERSCLLIVCTDIGVFGIKADDPAPKWVGMKGSVEECPFSGRWVLVGNNVCTTFEVARFGVRTHSSLYKDIGSLIPEYRKGVLCSERVDNGVILCSVQGTLVPKPHVQGARCQALAPYLMVNVVKFEMQLLEIMSDMWKAIRSDKWCNFGIETFKDCEEMGLIGCFPFKGSRPTDQLLESKALEDDMARLLSTPEHNA